MPVRSRVQEPISLCQDLPVLGLALPVEGVAAIRNVRDATRVIEEKLTERKN